MKNDCSLIVTLPRIYKNENKIKEIFENELVSSVRLNTGVNQLIDNKLLLEELIKLKELYKKIIWLDIKGRQLRINAWADTRYEVVELNHDIEIEYPAYIQFRNGSESEINYTRGNKIILRDPPKEAVGKGQSVNIRAKELVIKGYLTENDKELLELSKQYGLNDIMASFVEDMNDLSEILKINQSANIISKIESLKGIQFINENLYLQLMAARDDLYIETGRNLEIMKYLKLIIAKDPKAICASKIFDSLESSSNVALQDYSDLELMYNMGYRSFMLGDNVSNYKLTLALRAWRDFTNE